MSVTAITDFSKYYGKISNSGSDERGKYSGGQAGDQTGREWAIINWYNRPWNYVIRINDENIRNMMATVSIYAAENRLVGYNQNKRTTYWQHLKASNYDPRQITVACDDDCSAGVLSNLKAALILTGNQALADKISVDGYTGNMRAMIVGLNKVKAGLVSVFTDANHCGNFDNLYPGDILLYEGHHTACNLGLGKNMAAAAAPKVQTPASNGGLNKTPKWVGKVTASRLNVRTWAGAENPLLTSYPQLGQGNLVDVCDTISAKDGKLWYYVRIAGHVFGFVSANYIQRV